jgi:hypothetical protein
MKVGQLYQLIVSSCDVVIIADGHLSDILWLSACTNINYFYESELLRS